MFDDNVISNRCRVAESLVELVNSLTCKKPYKTVVNAAHNRRCLTGEKLLMWICCVRVWGKSMVMGSL